jgi:hypothetical protein
MDRKGRTSVQRQDWERAEIVRQQGHWHKKVRHTNRSMLMWCSVKKVVRNIVSSLAEGHRPVTGLSMTRDIWRGSVDRQTGISEFKSP